MNAMDWLDGSGDLPYEGPNELFRNAFRMAQCIEYGGPLPRKHLVLTMIGCRRRPGGQSCRGTMSILKTERDELYVVCASCKREEFLITNWEDTHWAMGTPDPVHVEMDPFAPFDDAPGENARVLSADGTLDFDAIRARIATASAPREIIQEVFEAQPPRSQAAANELASLLLALWNATPRPELGGKSPEEVYSASRPKPAVSSKVGRNRPCPCGSGLKFKRCCAH